MKRLLVQSGSAFALFALAVTATAAPVTGRVSFNLNKGQKPVTNETLVWLEPAAGARALRRAAPVNVTMITRGKVLIPHVLAIPVGSTVNFPNEDPISHNLFSLSSPNQFDLGLYRAGAGKSHTFTTPGVVNVYCNVHPNMSSVIHVLNTPYYAFTDANGNFSLTDVPAGHYEVVAWNEMTGAARTPIDVGGGTPPLALVLDARGYRAGQHSNKYGKTYETPHSREY
ncbi:MAG TPA: carboxypeptidase regulatory-like domain-containing protein [Thermoanaerobaculia bacterium]|jgi:plastocyanin